MSHQKWNRFAGALLVGVLVAGCSGTGKLHTGASAEQDPDLPKDPNALVLGAEVALQRKQYREAARAYVRAAQATDDESIAEQAAKVAFEHQQWTLVQVAADRWLQLNPTNEEARRFAAFAALHLYQIDRAAEHLGVLLEAAFINPQAGFLALLPQLADEATPPAMMAVLQRLLAKYENLAEAHYALARAALQAENLALAHEHAKRATELAPYWSRATLFLGQMQLVMGQTEEGLATAREALEQDPQPDYRLEYALMLIQAGRDEEGRRELVELAKNESTAAFAERALADIEFQMGNRESARQRYVNLLANGRFVYESLFYLGAIAESREAWDEALQIYERVTGGNLAVAAQVRAAVIKTRQKDLQAGLQHLEQFGSTRPVYRLETITASANLLANNGDRNGAIKLLEQALEEYPDSAELRFAYVFQLEAADKVDEAIEELRDLVEDRPEDPAATNALGYTLVDRTRRYREGLKYIEEALAVTPDSGAVLDSMGWALYRLKRNEEALEYLEKASKRINDPEVDLHIVEVLLALGRKDEAVAKLKEARERFPQNEDLKRRAESLPD
ncbi:MAG TPA: tetratricopeptide repeat protein [Steroidobacteraceae bacterium]